MRGWVVSGVVVFLVSGLAGASGPAIPLEGRLKWTGLAQVDGLVVPGPAEADALMIGVPDHEPSVGSRPFLKSEHAQLVLHRWTNVFDVPQVLLDQVSEVQAGDYREIVLTPLVFDDPQLLLLWSADHPSSSEAATSAERCLIQHGGPHRLAFPADDSNAEPKSQQNVTRPDALRAECTVDALRATGLHRVFVYGVNMTLDADGVSRRRIHTGTWNLAQEPVPSLPRTDRGSDIRMYQTTQILEIRFVDKPISVEPAEPWHVTLQARSLVAVGNLHMPESVGDLRWGARHTSGRIDPVDAGGRFSFAAASSHVDLRGQTENGPTTPSSIRGNPVPWTQWTQGAAAAVGLLVLWRLALVLFNRIPRTRILNQPLRRRLLDTIATTPGISIAQLSNRNGLARPHAAYHVRRLRAAGHVVYSRVGGRTALFLPGQASNQWQTGLSLATRPTYRQLLAALKNAPATQEGLCRATGLHQSNVSRALTKLVAVGWVQVNRSAGRAHYSIALAGPASPALEAPVAAA